jgi:hypothetical protein
MSYEKRSILPVRSVDIFSLLAGVGRRVRRLSIACTGIPIA